MATEYKPDRIGSAIALRLCAAATATGVGICIHGATKVGATTGQVVFLRSVLSIPLLLSWAALSGPLRDMIPKTPLTHLLRGLTGATVMCLSFYALGQLPVAYAKTLAHLAPVLSVFAAAFLLGEHVTARALVAVALGFGGTVALVQTAATESSLGWAQLTGIAAGVMAAVLMAVLRALIRKMTATETTISIAMSFALITSSVGALAVLVTGWTPMTNVLWAWLGGAGLFGALTHIAATESSARAPVTRLAPFDYAGLVFAILADLLIFAHLPGAWGWVGIGLIVVAGLMMAWVPRPDGVFLRLK
jgi:drug/metabolite transporter (DMT)-like permease